MISKKLDLQPEECLTHLSFLLSSFVRNMWTEAEQLLSNDAYRELPSGQFCVAYGDKAFIVKCERNNFVCNCLDFQKFKVCSHVLIVADGKKLSGKCRL